MAIPARQIGQPSSTKAQLLWEISKQLEILTQVAGNVYIPRCPITDWVFTPAEISVFPANSDGYTLYTGNWTYFDDGQTSDSFPIGGEFFNGNGSDTAFYLSTNGYTIGATSNYPFNGNNQDLFITPGDPLDDGTTQNFWYQNTGDANKWKTSILVYCGHCCGSPNQQTPYSYVLNIYKDSQYQYLETVCKTNTGGSTGPGEDTLSSNTATQVWQSPLDGSSWTYLGFGSIQ